MLQRTRMIFILGLVACLLSACTLTPSFGSTPTPQAPLVVFAASSLTDAFNALGAAYEKKYPGARVQFNFAGSQTLAAQLDNGARADLFAAADMETMDRLRAKNLVRDTPRIFARNELAILIPANNPANLERVQDLNRAGLKIVIAAETVPVGKYTRQLIENFRHDAGFGPEFPATFFANVVSEETNVRQVLTKVALGEADAGIVYVTDAASAGDKVTVLDMPEGLNVTAAYPIAELNASAQAAQAQQFIAFVLSPQGQTILKQFGFRTSS